MEDIKEKTRKAREALENGDIETFLEEESKLAGDKALVKTVSNGIERVFGNMSLKEKEEHTLFALSTLPKEALPIAVANAGQGLVDFAMAIAAKKTQFELDLITAINCSNECMSTFCSLEDGKIQELFDFLAELKEFLETYASSIDEAIASFEFRNTTTPIG